MLRCDEFGCPLIQQLNQLKHGVGPLQAPSNATDDVASKLRHLLLA
jgi:hypothetical protein